MKYLSKSQAPTANLDKILSRQETAEWLGVHASTLDRWTSAGSFPEKIYLSKDRVGWPRSAVEAWLSVRRGKCPIDA